MPRRLINILFFLAIPGICFFISPAVATVEYAQQTGLECKYCHIEPSGGGALTETGKRFQEEKKAGGEYGRLSLPRKMARVLIGYLHIMAAIIWFGTILYVHILLKPAYASKGLPTGELRLGLISMNIVLITGVLLTIARIPSFHLFFSTRFGILLGLKIFLFLLMFSSAMTVAVYIGPRLRKKASSPVAALFSQAIAPEQLSRFDGNENRPAYIAYRGIVYDVTQGRLWKNGLHLGKHRAGTDLTDSLKSAPHGEEKIVSMPQIGALGAAAEKTVQPFHLRLFYFFAYMNLVLVFIITFVIALMRWW